MSIRTSFGKGNPGLRVEDVERSLARFSADLLLLVSISDGGVSDEVWRKFFILCRRSCSGREANGDDSEEASPSVGELNFCLRSCPSV